MNILFIHQNFPAQFKHLAPGLRDRGHKIKVLTIQKVEDGDWEGIDIEYYNLPRGTSPDIHPWVSDLESKTIRGEACFLAAMSLKRAGYVPDKIIAHHGWGETLFIKEVWPDVKLGIYCEFFYHTQGTDVGFDPEFLSSDITEPCRISHKNLNNLAHFQIADGAISPTSWQASTFPSPFKEKITVVHDGIDTDLVAPNKRARINLKNGKKLTAKDEIVTFINRNFEPYRGYHIFMRALPKMLKERPKARFILIGGDEISYGAKPDPQKYGNRSWKQVFINEVTNQISKSDWKRVHFVGKVPYATFLNVIQISSVHVYLTYPFVLSWSLLEAMSAGCAIVASDTPPLREAIENEQTGLLVDFFDSDALAETVGDLLENKRLRTKLGKQAREFAIDKYNLKTKCLPKQIEWVEQL